MTETRRQLLDLVNREAETESLDFKGPTSWDDANSSCAELAKDIMAFANQKGGGTLVIGREQLDDGTFGRAGLTPEQSTTFDSTKVADWVNARCSPPVRLRTTVVMHEEKRFVVIEVLEFDDIPVICTRDLQEPAGKRFLLKRGVVYVRAAGNKSEPLQSADDLRRLILLSASKQRPDLLEAVRGLPSAIVQYEEKLRRDKEIEVERHKQRMSREMAEAQLSQLKSLEPSIEQYFAERWDELSTFSLEEAKQRLLLDREYDFRHIAYSVPRWERQQFIDECSTRVFQSIHAQRGTQAPVKAPARVSIVSRCFKWLAGE